MNFTTYLINLAEALTDKSGADLAYLLSPRKDHGKTILKEFRNPTVRPPPCHIRVSSQIAEAH
jgi:COP9 signalosome complex subunit 12